jgi:hypothetical protein
MKFPTLPLLVIVFGVLAFPIHAHAQLDLGSPTSRTPYDAYMGPMWTVLRQLNGKADMETVKRYVRQGRGFHYSYNKKQPYMPQTPEETEAQQAGDCKAKSLWLASKMDDPGVRFVVGKAKLGQDLSHAWLIWNGPEGWMILDATLYSAPLSAARIRSNEFVPIYSYAPGGKYAHNVALARGKAKNGDHS